jgi:tetratricopeptide (TPR) repeat protein
VVAAAGAFVCVGTAPYAYAQQQGGQAQQPTKKVKDQGEYDLYNNVVKARAAKNAAQELQYLNQWVDKYPQTDFQDEQLQYYNELNQPAKVFELGQKILAKNPNDLAALTLIPANVQKIPNASQDQMDLAQKCAQTLLSSLDSLKPPTVTDDQWKQAKPSLEQLAKQTSEWIVTKPARDAEDQKNYPAAETAYTKLVQQFPDNWLYAYKLGTVLVAEKNPDKYPLAIYEMARSLEIGGMPAQNKTQVEPYLVKIYNSYHGQDDDGLKQLRTLAKASPLPPADFHLKTQAEIATEKENEFREKNPQLALWMGVKKQLADTNGDTYFESQLKNAAVPKLKGVIVEAKPACRSKELLVAVPLPDAKPPYQPEITLKLDTPLKGKPAEGTEIQFEGVPSEFTKDPFMLTMDIQDADKLEGATTTPCTVPARKSAKKK